jgi:DNA anti-recombination protein RmuC
MAKEETTEVFSEEQVKRTQKIANETRRVKDEVGKLNQLSKTFGEHLGDIAKTFTAINLANISGDLLKTAKSMTELNTELHRSVINAVKGQFKKIYLMYEYQCDANFGMIRRIY